MMKASPCDDQHLAEMEVAVDARLQSAPPPVAARRAQRPRAAPRGGRAARRPSCDAWSGQESPARACTRSAASSCGRCRARPSARSVAASRVARGAKAGSSVGSRQRGVQLAEPPADGCGERRHSSRTRRPRPSRRLAGDATSSTRAVKIVQRPGPAVALVAHEALREQASVCGVAVGVDARRPRRAAAACWRSRARSESGVISTSGWMPGADAADDLQHHRVADDQRTVGLLGRRAGGSRRLGQRRAPRAGGVGCEAQIAPSASGIARRRAARRARRGRSAVEREGVGQQADAAAAPHARPARAAAAAAPTGLVLPERSRAAGRSARCAVRR